MTRYLGLYIHIPFCAGKCAYCDFYSLAGQDKLIPQYQRALIGHLREYAPRFDAYHVDTVYFGGGTPSYYGASRLTHLFNKMKKHYNILIESEVTIEVNPDSISYRDLKKLRNEGFNRLSIGAQSANDGILKSIGRLHSFAQVEQTVKDARRAGFSNISIDLIYGLPSQTKEDWADTLNRTVVLKPEHLSCYGLKIEEGTPLYILRSSPDIPDEDAQADMYLYTVETLGRFGYRQYEISNFSLPGKESRHNLKYWTLEEYAGFGAAAHSNVGGLRYACPNSVQSYIDKVERDRVIVSECEEIGMLEKAGEYLMLGLRLNKGISEREYLAIYRSNFEPIETLLKKYQKKGLAQFNDGRWSFTPHGFLLSNRLIANILDAQSKERLNVGMPWKKTEQQSLFSLL